MNNRFRPSNRFSLFDILSNSSSSMSSAIAEEGTDPFAPQTSTRWNEAKRLASEIIDLCIAVKPDHGINIRFINEFRASGTVMKNVTSKAGLSSVFSVNTSSPNRVRTNDSQSSLR